MSMHAPRPFLVGLVCWLLIISGSLSGYTLMKIAFTPAFGPSMEIFPYPAQAAEIILFGTLVMMIVCGICMYEGLGWARYVYLPGSIPLLLQTYFSTASVVQAHPDHSWMWWLYYRDIAFYLFSAVVLFLPQARRFFHPPLYIDE